MHRVGSAFVFAALLAFHFDVWWRAPRPPDDVLPGLPAELAFRLLWLAAAWLWLLHFTAKVWTSAPPTDQPAASDG